MNNQQVAHLWANEAKPSGRGSNFFFDGPLLFSYGRHFTVGRIVRNAKGKRAYLLNSRGYSPSTGRHQSYARRAIAAGETIFYVPDADDRHTDNRGCYKRELSASLERVPATRSAYKLSDAIGSAQIAAQSFNAYSAFFSLRGRVKVPVLSAADTARLTRYQASQTARDTKREAERAVIDDLNAEWARRAALTDAERRQEFRNGAPRSGYIGGPVMLRLVGDTFQTSQGADVPRVDGARMLQFIAARIDNNGLPFNYPAEAGAPSAGGFTLRSISADEVVIGCHHIPVTECAAMAATVGVEWPL